MKEILMKTNKKERLVMILSAIFIFFQVWLDLRIPEYMSKITELVQGGATVSQVMEPGIKMIVLALGSFATSVLVGYFAAKVAASLATRLRKGIFSKVQSFSEKEMNSFSVASLITRTTNDVTQIQRTVAIGLQVLVKAPITAVWGIYKIAGKQWEWTAVTAAGVIILGILLYAIMKLIKPIFEIVQVQTDSLNRTTRENLTGIRVVRAYNAEEYQEDKFEEVNTGLTDNALFANRVLAIMQPSMHLVASLLVLLIYWIGSFLIQGAGATAKLTIFSDMVVFSSYALQIILGFMLLIIVFILLPRATVSANRINEILNTPLSIKDGDKDNKDSETKGKIEFKNVSFRYPDAQEDVLKDISFTANPGDTVAFIGATGSGKSTLINLIPRFYDVTEGEVLVDDLNVKEYKEKSLNNKLGYIPQVPVMFSGDIESNIKFGDSKIENMSEEDIYDALDIAQATEFVENLPKKIESNVAQGGTNYSGGQKQRLGIGRAIARKPEILIFDDSFSALDYQTDKKLRKVLNEKTKDTTKLIVAQRISTIMDADQILVIDEGEVAGKGTHEELLVTNDIYKEIAYSQLSEEELINER